eukprot:3646544-Prymnesium_polylepis.1
MRGVACGGAIQMAACARALRMPVRLPRVHDIPATLHVVASVRARVTHSPATALSRTYVKRAVHATPFTS